MLELFGQLENSKTNPRPSIECYLPEPSKRNGAGIIIFPGGGYTKLAEHEGKGYADFFTANGYAAFVVRYRLASEGHKHPAMLEDGLAAIGTVRSQCAVYGVEPNKIGVIGSSAGGHLAAHCMVSHPLYYKSSVPLRPDFGVLCYPVITMIEDCCHLGSRNNLIGPNPDRILMKQVSCEKHISDETPPCFIWHTADDPVVKVEHSFLFVSALREENVPYELHVYQTGRHGLGLGAPFKWQDECLRWISETLAS